jgi:hypothetical protein
VTISKRWLALLPLMLLTDRTLDAQQRYYAGAVAGIATLSADAQTAIESAATAVSLYRPFNGPALNAFGGVHLTDVVTLQGNYVWNRNALTVFTTRLSNAREDLLEEKRSLVQQAVIGDVLIYFRNREQWARPYLSAGAGAVRLESESRSVVTVRGIPPAPAPEFSSTLAALRVAVGIDVALGSGWAFRFTFSEMIQQNPVSERLSPAGQRNLANFQNLFGILKRF